MSKPGKNNIAYSGYLIPETGALYMTKPEWFNYETVIHSFREFLAHCPPPEGKQYCLIMDNAPWHKKAWRLIWKERRPEYADIRSKMICLLLPPYSPDLNPIEQVWRITRREVTHNRYFRGLQDLTERLDQYFDRFKEANSKLSSLCDFKCFHEPIEETA